MESSMRSLPMFSMANYDEWRIHRQVHLAAMNDEMWDVIQYGPSLYKKRIQSMHTTLMLPNIYPRTELSGTQKTGEDQTLIIKQKMFSTDP